MPKILRALITFIAAIILLGLVALIGLVVFVNPNDLKPQISQAVMKFTGHQLQLGGDIQWSLFPWLGLQLHDARLSNKPGFGDKPLAEIQKLDIQVRLLPLLHKQLEIGKLQVDGLSLYLIKNTQGQTNWQDTPIVSSSITDTAANPTLPNNLKPLGFMVAGLDIRDGHILFEDQQKNKRVEITQLQLNSANLAVNKSSPFHLQFNFNTNLPDIHGTVKLLTDITLSSDGKNIDFNKLNLTELLKGSSYPKDGLPLSFKGNVQLNLNEEAITANHFVATVNQIKLTGNLMGQHLFSNPSLTGTLTSQDIKAGALKIQQIQLPFEIKDHVLSLNPITATLYQGHYQGNANVNFSTTTPHITSHNQFRRINIQSLCQDLNHKSQIQLAGFATFNLDMTTQGSNNNTLIKNLQGQGQFNLDKGAIKGINLSYWIAVGKALIKHSEVPATHSTETPFDTFAGSFTIKQGIIGNNNLIIRSGRLRVNGKGMIDLPQQQIHYEVEAQPILADGSPDGIAIPIKIVGPLQNIHVQPAIDKLSLSIFKEKIKGRLGDTLKKLDLKKLFQ